MTEEGETKEPVSSAVLKEEVLIVRLHKAKSEVTRLLFNIGAGRESRKRLFRSTLL